LRSGRFSEASDELVVVGVFMVFYLQPYRKQTEGEPITPTGPKPTKRAQELHPIAH